MPYQVIYSSRASQPLDSAGLEQILVDARTGNEHRDVTGALVYSDGLFLQVLEGDRDVVMDLVESIRADSRHQAMKVFHQKEVDERSFSDWRMAYLNPDPAEMSRWSGLEGAGTVDELVAHVHRDPDHVPRILVRILEAIATHSERR